MVWSGCAVRPAGRGPVLVVLGTGTGGLAVGRTLGFLALLGRLHVQLLGVLDADHRGLREVHAMGDQRDTGRQYQFAYVQGVADLQGADVDRDELRQVLRQTADLDFDHVVVDHTAGLLAGCRLLVAEVQRHVHDQRLALADAQQVHVDHACVDRMTLQGLEHHLLGLAIDVDAEDVREEGLVLELPGEVLELYRNRLRFALATVDDGGHAALPTQAPRHCAAVAGTRFGDDFELVHDCDSVLRLGCFLPG